MKKHLFLLLTILLSSCTQATPTPLSSVPTLKKTSFELTSPAFANGETIPAVYTCKGKNTSPALTWTVPPTGTQSFALILEDPDAPGIPYIHWVVFNIPAVSRGFMEAVPYGAKRDDGSIQGLNSSSGNGYQGPCPPSGTHHYAFKLYALDTVLSLESNAKKKDVESAINGHILASAELIGTFGQ